MWFRGPDADIAWFILIFVIVSLGAILGKFYILNKKKQSDESARADLKASKTFIVICILTLILVPSGIIMYDNYIYQAKDIIDRADGQVKQADSKSNTIKKLLEIAGRLGRSAETAEEAKKLEEISKKLRRPKNKKNLTEEDIALLNKYRPEWDPKFKPAPAPVIKTVPDLLKANKEISRFATEISPDVAKKIESKEFVLMPGLKYTPAKDGKSAFIRWDGRTMNTGIIHNGKKYTETGTYRGEATPEELRSVGIEPTTQSTPSAPEQPATQPKAPEPVAEPAVAKDPAPEAAKLLEAETPQPEAPPPSLPATKAPSGRPSTPRPQNVTTIPELIRDKAVSSLLSLRERLLSSVPKNFSELKHGFQEYLENLGNPNSMPLQLYRKQKKLLKEQAGITPKPAKPVERPDVKPTRPEAAQPNTTANIANKQTEPAVHPAEEVPKVDQINDPGTPPPKQEPGIKPGFKVKDFVKDKLGIENDKYQSVDNWLESARDWVQSKLLGEYPKAYWGAASKWVSSARVKAKAKAQAKTDAKAKEKLLEKYGPEEEFEFSAKPKAEQAPKVEPGPNTAEGAVPPNAGPQVNTQAPKSNFNAFMKIVLDPKANAKDAFRLGKGIVWDPVFHPIKTTGRAIGGALGTAAAATEMNIAANRLTNKQPVGLVDMFTNLPQALWNRIRMKDDKNPEWTRKVMIPAPDNPNGSGATGEDGKTTSSETETAANEEQKQNKNPGTIVTSWLPESFKNISVNDYPVGGSLFGALAGGALGAGFGGLNYILTDENELSEEEKKKRSLARAMLSSAGIGAGIGGAIGGLDDWGRSAATSKKA